MEIYTYVPFLNTDRYTLYIINVHLGGNGSVNAPLAFSPEKLLALTNDSNDTALPSASNLKMIRFGSKLVYC
jgi:hypothetical protein